MIRKRKIAAIFGLLFGAGTAEAQIVRYDADSGRYVTVDPFQESVPTTPNPNRLNPSIARSVTSRLGAPVSPPAGTTEEAALASQLPVPAGQPPQAAPDTTAGTPAASGLVPLGDMALYDPASPDASPFAKPDWWPK